MTVVTEQYGEFKVWGLKKGNTYTINVQVPIFVTQKFTGMVMEKEPNSVPLH